MQIKITKIGNSKGIRLPKNVIKECGFEDEVSLTVEQKRVILTAVHQERYDWREKVSENQSISSDYGEEWEW